jgi:hypothetical protein
MTDKQRLALLRKAERELKLTGQGYIQWAKDKRGGHWPDALSALAALEKDRATVVPDLGPIWAGGKSVLLQDLTHATTGIPLYPAFDDAFKQQGRVIIAPEPLTVDKKLSSANPGFAFYATGRSKLRYWFGHLDRAHPLGTKFAKGDAVGKVAANSIGGGPHVHLGINVELLLGPGKQLKHHTDYTHGAPTVGSQLRVLL